MQRNTSTIKSQSDISEDERKNTDVNKGKSRGNKQVQITQNVDETIHYKTNDRKYANGSHIRMCDIVEIHKKQKKDNKYKSSNLNDLIVDRSIENPNGIIADNVHIYFLNLESTLIEHINKADAIIGCVAWLTNIQILESLKHVKNGISIIVQKEEFLRSKSNITNTYNEIKGLDLCFKYDSDIDDMYIDTKTNAIRCMGNYNENKDPAFPRMHNKFLVFGKINTPNGNFGKEFVPYAVWTGSFNLTYNGSKSMENSVYIQDSIVANAYTNMWKQIFTLSETLCWKHNNCTPIFNINVCKEEISNSIRNSKQKSYSKHKFSNNKDTNYDLNNVVTEGCESILYNNECEKNNVKINAHFIDLEGHLVRYIENADVIVGCVAWLTNTRILSALEKKQGVMIIVQKEDFLRPDCKNIPHLKNLYDKLKPLYWHQPVLDHIVKFDSQQDLKEVSYALCDELINYPIRCMGNYNSEKQPAFPRMHNKFIVFGKLTQGTEISNYGYAEKEFKPYAVWTGSFNFTHNSTNSLENGIYINSKEIASKYVNVWTRILVVSEQLDWTAVWCEPDLRFGS